MADTIKKVSVPRFIQEVCIELLFLPRESWAHERFGLRCTESACAIAAQLEKRIDDVCEPRMFGSLMWLFQTLRFDIVYIRAPEPIVEVMCRTQNIFICRSGNLVDRR